MRHLLLTTLIVLFASGCEKTEQATKEIKLPSTPVVGVLDTTGYQISLHTSVEGTRYSIQDPKGKILAEKITAGDFAQRFPNIHHEGRGLWAENFIKDPWRSNESGIDNRRRSFESRFDNAEIRPELFETPPPSPEDTLIELPPLPDLRTEDQITRKEKLRERRIREATNQPGK